MAKFKKYRVLNVLGSKYKVVEKDLKSLGFDGLFEYKEKQIIIDKDTAKDHEQYYRTLFHEAFHAALKESAIDQTDLCSNMEEIIVEQMSKVIYENFFKKSR